MNKFYKLFQAIYAFTKAAVGLNETKPKQEIHYLLILLSFGVFIASSLGIIVLYFIHLFVDIYLRIKYDKKYGGMLKGLDFLIECPERTLTINILLIIKRNGSYEDFEKTLRLNFKQIHESCCKLRYEIESALGYNFFIKSDVKFEDIFTVVDNIALNKNSIVDHLQTNFTDTNSILGNKAWKLFVFKEPIAWNLNNNLEHVVVLVFRHSIGDGISLASLLANKLDGVEPLSFGQKLKLNPTSVRSISFQNAYIYDNPFQQQETLYKSTESYMSIYIENNVKYIPLIKCIKNKLNVGFVDILMGCLAVALVNYGKMKGENIKKVELGCTIRPFDKETINVMEGRFNFDKISNKMLMVVMKGRSNIDLLTIKEVVQIYSSEGKKMRAGEDFVLSTVLGNMAHLLTIPIARRLLEMSYNNNIGMITNLVGLKSATISGNVIECAFGFAPFVIAQGFMLFVWSLRDKFQLCLQGPRSIINSKHDLDVIFEEMFKNIDRLSVELGITEDQTKK